MDRYDHTIILNCMIIVLNKNKFCMKIVYEQYYSGLKSDKKHEIQHSLLNYGRIRIRMYVLKFRTKIVYDFKISKVKVARIKVA